MAVLRRICKIGHVIILCGTFVVELSFDSFD